jgi:RNA polymerase sigma factor (sigma-70 family)
MSSEPGPRHRTDRESADAVSTAFLVASVARGDEAALRQLMARYDRLVRYTVFRFSRSRTHYDPQWLDGVASATWAGFVRVVRRDIADPPGSVSSLLTTIARNQTISAIRGSDAPATKSLTDDLEESAGSSGDPSALAARLEFLGHLRECLAGLDEDDRTLAGELPAILDRRWQEAAAALGLAESTLRSRWNRVLERLRACMHRKTGESFAPKARTGD